ncbi:hypothetical protein PCK1_000084 [Pneumocystis canis]|nr:hypothetical protein PCK1_000084 [Pneumocystis canis]
MSSHQDKLQAAKQHMLQVKKKKKEHLSIIHPVLTTNETDSSTEASLLKPFVQETHTTNPLESVEQTNLELKNKLSIIHNPLQLENQYIDESCLLRPSSLEISSNKQNTERTTCELPHQVENIPSNDNHKPDLFEFMKSLENTVNEMKSQVSLLQTNHLEMNEKLNTILLKIDTNHMLLQTNKKTEFMEDEKISDCNFCDGHFCGRHRQLENHACTGLQECRQQSHERNRTKLQKEQCVANKV